MKKKLALRTIEERGPKKKSKHTRHNPPQKKCKGGTALPGKKQ